MFNNIMVPVDLAHLETLEPALDVVAAHFPRHLDIVMPSHGGKLATHTDASVFLIRPAQ